MCESREFNFFLSALDLDFSTTEDRMGVVETVDLVPNGSRITVTPEKLEEYLIVQLQVHFLLLYLDICFTLLVPLASSCEASINGIPSRVL